jgi:hypothetical protein
MLTDAKSALQQSCSTGNCDFNSYFAAVNQAELLLKQATAESGGSTTGTTTGASVTTSPGST